MASAPKTTSGSGASQGIRPGAAGVVAAGGVVAAAATEATRGVPFTIGAGEVVPAAAVPAAVVALVAGRVLSGR